MVDLRVSYRRKGLSDVFIRNSCPPIAVYLLVLVYHYAALYVEVDQW